MENKVVQLDEAVELLVDHLVDPVLPRGQVDPEKALSPESQETVARQIHATVLIYNYYHRKQFPQLEFASPNQFSASLTTVKNKNILMFLNQAQNRLGTGVGAELSVTDKAIIDACEIADALDPTKDSPNMITWPISKVAVLLVNLTKNVCLLERGPESKGVWSTVEKDINTKLDGSVRSDMSVQRRSNEHIALASEPYMLQLTAYSEVEHKTGLKRTSLGFIEEHRVYSLSKKGTATIVFVLHYDQVVDSRLREVPLDALIQRMSGPIFETGPYPTTTTVVECYPLLPYKEVLLNVLNRDWALGSSQSTPKKQAVKAVGDNGTKNSNTSKNSKRKYEAMETTIAEHADGQNPIKDLHASVQMDKNRTDEAVESRDVPQDIIPTLDLVPVLNDDALKSQKEKASEKSGRIAGDMNDQKYATLYLLQEMLHDKLPENRALGDRIAEYQMDIQTMLTETEITPEVTAILKKYENSRKMMEVSNPISSGEGCQTVNIKRKKLKEAIVLCDRCQELDNMCHENNWILPRYTVAPSVTGDNTYQASVHLTGPDFNLRADGDMKVTPYEARNSAASNMVSQLQQKATEDKDRNMYPQNP